MFVFLEKPGCHAQTARGRRQIRGKVQKRVFIVVGSWDVQRLEQVNGVGIAVNNQGDGTAAVKDQVAGKGLRMPT